MFQDNPIIRDNYQKMLESALITYKIIEIDPYTKSFHWKYIIYIKEKRIKLHQLVQKQ